MKRPLIVITTLLLLFLLAAGAAADWTYTVQRGDTLYTISRRVGVSVNDLRRRNGLWTDALRVGQRITIPTGTAAATGTGGSRAGVDVYMLARLVHAEAEAEPYIGKVAVAAVVLNRIESPLFPNTLAGVLYQPHAFETVTNGRVYNNPSNEAVRAARDAVNGWDPSGGALYFFNPAKAVSSWIWSRTIVNRIGKHVFAI